MRLLAKQFYLSLLLLCSMYSFSNAQQSDVAAVDTPSDPVTELINEENTIETPVLTAIQMRSMQNDNEKLAVLDTRYEEAHELARITNSKHMGLTFSLEKVWMLDRKAPIVVYGDDTDHNKSMVKQLKQKGFTTVYYLFGTLGELELQGIVVEGDVNKSDKLSNKLNRKRK